MSATHGSRESTADKLKRLKRLIQVGKKQLEMADDSYRAMLMSETGYSSTTQMNAFELEKVVTRLRKLGFRIQAAGSNRALAIDRQSKKIRALWLDLHGSGLVRDPSEAALATYVKRQTGIEALQWLSSEQAARVIEALKSWLSRAPSN